MKNHAHRANRNTPPQSQSRIDISVIAISGRDSFYGNKMRKSAQIYIYIYIYIFNKNLA